MGISRQLHVAPPQNVHYNHLIIFKINVNKIILHAFSSKVIIVKVRTCVIVDNKILVHSGWSPSGELQILKI